MTKLKVNRKKLVCFANCILYLLIDYLRKLWLMVFYCKEKKTYFTNKLGGIISTFL